MPPLIIYNPPLWVRRSMPKGSKIVGMISEDVREVAYRHSEETPETGEREEFKHIFDSPGVQMIAIVGPGGQQSLLLVGKDGQNLWEDFDI
jgi:hypothetical protein